MRGLLLILAASLVLTGAVGPDEIRIAYRMYSPPIAAGFRAETRVVETAAVVRDRRGQIIDLLQQQDFRILDNGKERPITSFSVERAEAAGEKGPLPRAIALVFDNIAVRFACNSITPQPNWQAIAGIQLMRDAAEKFVRKNLRPHDLISIIGFNEGQITPFTNREDELIAGIRKVAVQQTCIPPNKLGIVEDVVDYMSRFRGDRSIVLGSTGFGAGPAMWEEIIQKALRSQVPIHTLDMRGVGFLGTTNLGYLANSTGGRASRNSNDFDAGLNNLLSRPAVTYLLGFTPDNARDGRYHSLKVQLPGRQGYSVEARPGYYAPDEKEEKPRTESPTDRAVFAEDTRNDVPVTLTALPDQLVTGGPAVSVVAHFDLTRLTFRSQWERHVQSLRVIAALLDSAGNFVAGKEGNLELALKDSSLAELSKQGVNATLTLPAPAGAYRVRMVVEEQGGKLTASSTQVRIP